MCACACVRACVRVITTIDLDSTVVINTNYTMFSDACRLRATGGVVSAGLNFQWRFFVFNIEMHFSSVHLSTQCTGSSPPVQLLH